MLFQHGRAGAGGRNHVVETLEGSDGLLRQRAGVGAVARVVGRLAAAGLRLGHLDTAAGIFQQLHGSKAHRRPHHVDQAGHEEPDARALFSHERSSHLLAARYWYYQLRKARWREADSSRVSGTPIAATWRDRRSPWDRKWLASARGPAARRPRPESSSATEGGR